MASTIFYDEKPNEKFQDFSVQSVNVENYFFKEEAIIQATD
jgi:hypothetical protein